MSEQTPDDPPVATVEDQETAIGGACHSVYVDLTALAGRLTDAMESTADYSIAPHVIAAHRGRLDAVRAFCEARRDRMTPGERRAVRILARESANMPALPEGSDE
jgi:hypothetical protein